MKTKGVHDPFTILVLHGKGRSTKVGSMPQIPQGYGDSLCKNLYFNSK